MSASHQQFGVGARRARTQSGNTAPGVSLPENSLPGVAPPTPGRPFPKRESLNASDAREVSLAAAVIGRAMDDISCAVVPPHKQNRVNAVSQDIRREAIMFLTATHGEWAESRERLCDAAGINAGIVRKEALRRLKVAGR